MSIKIIYKDRDIKKFISELISQNKFLNIKVEREVEKIFQNIRAKGDKALFNYAKKFDGCKLNEKNIVINKNKIKVFAKKCPKDIANALFFSASRIKKFHLHQIPKNYKYKFLINPQSAFKLIPKKDTYGDKRLSGETLVVGGSKKYPGSILMAASASLETGVGLLSLAIPLSIYGVIAGKIPEATLDTIKNNQEFISKDNIKHLFENKKRINSLLIGCGMEVNKTTQESVEYLLKNISNHFKYLKGIVIDADGLNNLSKINEWWKYKLPKNTIITPHVREMSRLTGLSISEINKNPIEILETYTKLWNVTIVLKGPLTFIGNTHKKYMLNRPNPGLAKGGTGDVLAGVINSFLAQGLNSEHSTILAVSLISESGELSKEKYGIHGSTASKLINGISKLINQNN